MTAPRYLVGIDLGTSNCAAAAITVEQGSRTAIADVPITQLIALGEVAARPLLPSFLYLPGGPELLPDAVRLPWDPVPQLIIGEFARWQGARVPGRLVSSAKSWLCHPDVDRSANILPWGASAEVSKISPVTASAALLNHIARSWAFSHPDDPLAHQEVVLTVPASFDEMARSLTAEAARHADLGQFSLLEEPQAAFYAFMAHHRRDLGQALGGVRLVLVVDVGGGTTDFSLIQVSPSAQGPLLRRLAVSDHLMLGGDNMDAALGRIAESRMTTGGRPLSAVQWTQVVQVSRLAKETLLSAHAPAHCNLSVAGESSRLVGGTLSATLIRAEVEQTILDGFFPRTGPDERPTRDQRTGLQEFGLPYVQDPAVTRHLAAFLSAHGTAGFEALGSPAAGDAALPRPDALLLNGGVFKSQRIAERLAETLSSWWPDALPVRLLPHGSVDLSVARGAAYYGLVRHGHGRRIGGGTARAYYVGLEEPSAPAPRALCLIPRGHEEGIPVAVADRVFELTVGRPVQFPLFATTADRTDAPGTIVPITGALAPLPPLHSVLTPAERNRTAVPVHLESVLTPIGTLEVSCVSNISPEQWRLEFGLRNAGEVEPAPTEALPPGSAEARALIHQMFGVHKGGPSTPAHTKVPSQLQQVWGTLEAALGPSKQWSLPVLRDLWGALIACATRRRRSPRHERTFYQALGYLLRPGFGYPLDEWRCEQAAALFTESIPHLTTAQIWIEFWIMWRRIAGGLTPERQAEIWDYLKPHIGYRLATPGPGSARPKGKPPEGLDEMVRLAAALEHLPGEEKVALGQWIVPRLRDPAQAGGPWAWALGRLGARVPLYGSAHTAVPPDQAGEWLDALLHVKGGNPEEALFAAITLCRMTGDRSRDVGPDARQQLVGVLETAGARASWIRLVTEVVELERAEAARVLGDTLPIGLRLA